MRRRVLIGTYVLSAGYYDAYYLRAQKVRALILRDFTEAFAQVDALLTPTAPSAAFAQGENMDDPIKMYLNDVFTVPANMAGVPAMSVPAGLDANGLPLGLQVIGKPFDEETVFAVGAAMERAAGFDALPQIRAGADNGVMRERASRQATARRPVIASRAKHISPGYARWRLPASLLSLRWRGWPRHPAICGRIEN